MPQQPVAAGPAPGGMPPGLAVIVLDTNALLDWVVFNDPIARPLQAALQAGRLRWIACESMQTEWAHVWPRSAFARWQPDAARAQAVFAQAQRVPEPPRGPLRCKDPDDQVFIDLAVQHRARWLLTKDAALLKLARRARLLGVEVTTLAIWSARATAEEPGQELSREPGREPGHERADERAVRQAGQARAG